jgi:hypothetical protein
MISALRGWPVREIEGSVRLSEPQRVSFYELVTSSVKTTDTLAGACPAETGLTPVVRMATLSARLAAVRAAAAAIRPPRSRASTSRCVEASNDADTLGWDTPGLLWSHTARWKRGIIPPLHA